MTGRLYACFATKTRRLSYHPHCHNDQKIVSLLLPQRQEDCTPSLSHTHTKKKHTQKIVNYRLCHKARRNVRRVCHKKRKIVILLFFPQKSDRQPSFATKIGEMYAIFVIRNQKIVILLSFPQRSEECTPFLSQKPEDCHITLFATKIGGMYVVFVTKTGI